MVLIKILAKVLAALNSNHKPGQIAAALAWALLLALVPAGSLTWILIFMITLLLRINWGFELLFILLLTPLAPLADPGLDALGWALLHWPPAETAAAAVYRQPLGPWFRLENSLTVGGLAAGLILWLPVYGAGRRGVALYRETLAPRIAHSKPVKALKGVPWISKGMKAFSYYSRLS